MSECEYERIDDDGGMFFCRLPDGHNGDHQCTSACGYPDTANTHPYGASAPTNQHTQEDK